LSNKKLKQIKTAKEVADVVPAAEQPAKTTVGNPALTKTLADLNKKFNCQMVGLYKDLKEDAKKVKKVSTGIMTLDEALGGGLPLGRIVEIYGPEAGGKTVTATYLAIQVQKILHKAVAVIDLEHTFDAEVAELNGLDIENLILAAPDSGEQAFEIVEALVRCGQVGLIVFDSVASATPQSELEKDIFDSVIGSLARLMSTCLKKLVPIVRQSECTVVFINQLREKVGVMYGNPETQPGGRALKFYSSIRIDVRPDGYLNDTGKSQAEMKEAAGHKIKAYIRKNKVGRPFKTAEFDLYYGVGIDLEKDVIKMGIAKGVIEKCGAWFSYISNDGELIKLQGEDNITNALKEKKLIDEVRERVLQVINKEQEREPEFLEGDDNGDDEEAIPDSKYC
jgi:recombination protein RecA